MSSYAEEQEMELEALESIYPDSFKMISDSSKKFTVTVLSEEDDLIDKFGVSLQFTYTEKYPEENLEYSINLAEIQGNCSMYISKDFISELQDKIEELLEENVGEVVVFTIVSEIQELLNNKKDEIIKSIEEEKEKKEREEKEALEKKCHGTKVTVASFLEWRENFLQEVRILEEQKQKNIKKNKKPTGKEIFLLKADGDFADELLEGEEKIDIDESLFEDLDDLNLEEF